jgi:hypothetical protein
VALHDDRLQEIFSYKRDGVHGESWCWIDNTIVIYDFEDPPAWLVPILEARDEDGYTSLA